MSKLKQLDIFGGEVDIQDIPTSSGGLKGERKYSTMQALYGEKPGFTCKTCAHRLDNEWNGRHYYKCELWRISSCAATDIRLKDTACNMWEAEK